MSDDPLFDPDDHWVFWEVDAELKRVRRKFPHTDACSNGTSAALKIVADRARQLCDVADKNGELTFAHVFREEAYEVLSEEDDLKLREELVQVMAVCTRWVRAIDRRRGERDARKEDEGATPEGDEEDDR